MYDNPPDWSKDQELAQISTPDFPVSPLTGDTSTLGDLFSPSNGEPNTDGIQVDFNWDVFDDITTQSLKTDFPQLNDPIPIVGSNRPFTTHNINSPYLDPGTLLQPPELTSSALTVRDENLSTLSKNAHTFQRSSSNFLAQLPISDPVSQFIATSVLEMIRTYPLMMLRAETLPSFIHGHWYRQSNTIQSSMPEPLVNCMGIAQIFASHSTESKHYLWHLVKMEQSSFIGKVRSL